MCILTDKFESHEYEFLIDPSCASILPSFNRNENVCYRDIRDETYKDIAKLAEERKATIVTSDKFILSRPEYRNKIAFTDSRSFKQEIYNLANIDLC